MDAVTTNPVTEERFTFNGKGGEYFGIVFVNSVLIIITLGLFAPWAKVRNLNYLYSNTELGSGSFQFTADPKRILVSYLLAFGVFAVFTIAENIESTMATIVYSTLIGGFLLLSPILTVLVLSFRMRYSAWRGINFSFKPNYKESYAIYLPPVIVQFLIIACLWFPFNSTEVEQWLGMTGHVEYTQQAYAGTDGRQEENDVEADPEFQDTFQQSETDSYINPYFFIPSGLFFVLFLLLLPYFDFINMRFLIRNVRFGTAEFNYLASKREIYRIYIQPFIVALLIIGLFSYGAISTMDDSSMPGNMSDIFGLGILLAFFSFFYFSAFIKSRRYNHFIGRTSIENDKHRIQANVPLFGMLWVLVSNFIIIVLSLGFMRPWAKIRLVRYTLNHTWLGTTETLDGFESRQHEEISALGEEIADGFDLDVGF